MLGNTAGLAVCHICMTDCIQERSLTMIDMPHDADYRRTFYHLAFIFFIFFEKFLDHIDDFLFLAEHIEIQCDLFGRLIIDLLVHCNHFSLQEQLLDDHGRNYFHLVSKFLDRQDFRDYDLFDLLFLLFFLRLRFLSLCYLFLLPAFSSFSFERFVSVFLLLVVAFFIFRLVSLALLLFHYRSVHIIPAGISSVSTRSLT